MIKGSPLKRIENSIFYAGVGHDNFKKLYPKIRGQMLRDNRNNLITFIHIAAILLLLVFVVSLLTDMSVGLRTLYGVMLGFCIVLLVLTRHLKTDSIAAVRCLMYTFTSVMILFAIILGTVFSPDELAATFVVMLIATPLIFADRPIYFMIVILASYVIFLVFTLIFDEPATLTTELINGTVFMLFAMVSCVHTMNVKGQKYFLEYANRIAGETDALTELRNRKSYEDAIRAFDLARLPHTYFVFMDANGLHEMNDNNGHEAGDKMLVTVSRAFREQFGEKTYRIGGDEFVTFGWDKTPEEIELAVKFVEKTVESSGYFVSIGVAFGGRMDTFRQLVQAAEADMYEKKNEYYVRTGKKRRRI